MLILIIINIQFDLELKNITQFIRPQHECGNKCSAIDTTVAPLVIYLGDVSLDLSLYYWQKNKLTLYKSLAGN